MILKTLFSENYRHFEYRDYNFCLMATQGVAILPFILNKIARGFFINMFVLLDIQKFQEINTVQPRPSFLNLHLFYGCKYLHTAPVINYIKICQTVLNFF